MGKKTYQIQEIGEVVGGGTPSTKIAAYWDGDIAWISPVDLSHYNNVYIEKGKNNITQLGLKKSSTVLLPPNTVLLTSRAPIGYMALAKNSICTNQGFKSIICNPKFVNYRYLYYYLRQSMDYIKLFASGSTFPELSGTRLKRIKITIEQDVTVQKKIASILSAYDDLIENNNKRIKILEQMAENLYKEWFVRFRFPGHETAEFENGIPKGWEIRRLDEVSKLSAGGDAPKDFSFVQSKEYPIPIYSNGMANDGLYGYCKKPTRTAKSITISARGTVGFVCLRFQPYMPIVRLVSIEPKNESLDVFYLYYYFKENSIEGYGTSQQQITIPYLSKKKILIPKINLMEKFGIYTAKLYDKINVLKEKNQNLIKQRDLLLPRLMSGKLEVKNAK